MNRCCLTILLLLHTGCGGSLKAADDPELSDLTPKRRSAVRVALIQTLIESKAYDSAVPMLNQAFREAPKDPRLHVMRATILRERGRLEQAQKQYELAIKFAPNSAQAHAGLGIVLNMLGHHGKASEAHLKATKFLPGHSQNLNNLGFSLYLQKQYVGAVNAYEAAIRFDPRLRVAYVNLGFALAAQKKVPEAKRAFQQVLSSAQTLNNLALAEELRGKPEKARALYEQALITDPKIREAAENLKEMDLSPSSNKEQP